MVSRSFLWREDQLSLSVPHRVALAAAFNLARFGIPYTLSTFVGAGVINLVPFFINARLGQESVGYYRAASLIAVNYLAFLLNSMSQDYYPRISAVSDQPKALVVLVNQQFRLAMLMGAPIVLGFLAMSPFVIPLINTAKFAPAVDILEWQLIGDLFKLTAWSMGFVILARSSSILYFCTEAVAGATMIGTTWLAIRWMGLPGIGFAFLVTSAIHCCVVWLVVRREIDFHWTPGNMRLAVSVLSAAAIIRALPFVGLAAVRFPVALLMTLIMGSYSAYTLWGEVRGPKPVPALNAYGRGE
jgi:PST family polysaccharide transporter